MVKCLIGALIIIMMMQIKVGDETLEEHANEMIHQSQVFMPLQNVADSVERMSLQAWKWCKSNIWSGADQKLEKGKTAARDAIEKIKAQVSAKTKSSPSEDDSEDRD
jgi:hypothetical protein